MPKNIIFYTLNYDPESEAISKEISLLQQHFESKIFDITTKFTFQNSEKFSKFHFCFLPFIYNLMKKESQKYSISHIYTSLGDRIFLKALDKKPIILTAGASTPIQKIREQSKHYHKLDKVIVGTQREKNQLIKLGVEESKIAIICPAIDTSKFYYNKEDKFRILFATSPPDEESFYDRGIYLLLDVAKSFPFIEFVFLWRKAGYNKLLKEIEKRQLKNIRVMHEIIKDPNKILENVSCTIAPFTEFSVKNKLVPLSILESLAAGKPVLISDRVAIKNVITHEKAGIVFKPSKEELKEAIRQIKQNYSNYQENAMPTAKKYFTKEQFLEKYKQIYDEISSRYNQEQTMES